MRRTPKQLILMGILGVITMGLALLAGNGGILPNWALDRLWRLRESGLLETQKDSPVVIAAVDNKTLRALRGNLNRIPRKYYASLVETLHAMDARWIAFDVLFDELSNDEDDEALERAVRNSKRVIANCYLKTDENFSKMWLEGRAFFRKHCVGEGFADIPLDNDEYLRRTRLYAPKGDLETRVSLALAIYLTEIDAKPDTVKYLRHSIEIPRSLDQTTHFSISHDHRGLSLIGFFGGAGSLRHLSVLDILEGRIPKEEIAGKIVLIGGTAEEFRDSFHTPFSPKGDLPGVEIHGHILTNLLKNTLPSEISGPRWWLAMLFLAFAVATATGLLRVERVGPILAVMAIPVLLLSMKMFTTYHYFMNFFDIWGAFASGCISSALADNLLLRRERNQIISAFGRYVSPNLLSEILKNPEAISLGGARREAVVLFADIRGFTKLCEAEQPENIINFLNTYFSAVTQAVFDHGGVLDKYIGDGLMAFFGVPIVHGNESQNAVDAALDMHKALARLRAEKSSGAEFPIEQIGIGIHGGIVVVGNVGSAIRLEYTVLGDTVNVASRLETACRQGEILVSDWIYKRLPENSYRIIERGKLEVRGRSEGVITYEVRSRLEDNPIRNESGKADK